MQRKKLLYFVTEDWYFVSHRIDLATEAKNKGFDITVLTNVKKHGDIIRSKGFNLINLNVDRHGKNIIQDIKIIYKIFNIYRRERPDIVHHIALKPVLYGTFCAMLTRIRLIINTFPGMGYLFESNNYIHRIYTEIIYLIFRIIFYFGNVQTIVQNTETKENFIRRKISKSSKIHLIRGSGVNLSRYSEGNILHNNTPIILFASRLLWQKGIKDFVEVANLVREYNKNIKFVIVGEPDEGNPNSVDESVLREWQNSGSIEWWGYRDDMPKIIRGSSIICLPTYYGEGIPKILIEAAACCKPIIATNVPGCREIVIDKFNGFLVPVHQPHIIADKINILINDTKLCRVMGAEGRKLVKTFFSIKIINTKTINLYKD